MAEAAYRTGPHRHRGQQTRRQHPYRADDPSSAPTDGATILISPARRQLVTHPLTYDKLQFDPDKDLIPVAHLADTPLVASPRPPARIRRCANTWNG